MGVRGTQQWRAELVAVCGVLHLGAEHNGWIALSGVERNAARLADRPLVRRYTDHCSGIIVEQVLTQPRRLNWLKSALWKRVGWTLFLKGITCCDLIKKRDPINMYVVIVTKYNIDSI